jgi:hypothetical protein
VGQASSLSILLFPGDEREAGSPLLMTIN